MQTIKPRYLTFIFEHRLSELELSLILSQILNFQLMDKKISCFKN